MDHTTIGQLIKAQNRVIELDHEFKCLLERAIRTRVFDDNADELISDIVVGLTKYRLAHKINKVFIGISGGIDSAVTAALFKLAGWEVHGYCLPINQNKEETMRGLEAIHGLGIDRMDDHIIDLSDTFDKTLQSFKLNVDKTITDSTHSAKVRRGNLKARLRMMTLYELASANGGLVASTDNFSEYSVGFWTLHGDVGDVSPIQSLNKSWEVPLIAKELGVPKSIIDAVPTDGLGITTSDEENLGFSYLHLDLTVHTLIGNISSDSINITTNPIFQAVVDKVRSSAFKRTNPCNFPHPVIGDYCYTKLLEAIEL